MDSLTFKYFGLKPIQSLISKELMNEIQFLQNSRIDALPMFSTTDLGFEQHIIDILNYNHLDDLSIILRKNKLNKLLNNSETSLNYEFLEFWYNNSEKLRLMIPI